MAIKERVSEGWAKLRDSKLVIMATLLLIILAFLILAPLYAVKAQVTLNAGAETPMELTCYPFRGELRSPGQTVTRHGVGGCYHAALDTENWPQPATLDTLSMWLDISIIIILVAGGIGAGLFWLMVYGKLDLERRNFVAMFLLFGSAGGILFLNHLMLAVNEHTARDADMIDHNAFVRPASYIYAAFPIFVQSSFTAWVLLSPAHTK